MTTTEMRHVTADDLYRLQLILDPQISPDGRHIVYGLQWVKRDEEKKYSNLWVVPTEGGQHRQFTRGEHSDSSPRWSPDGETIAFLSNREDEKQSQVYLLPFHGGEARQLTDLKGQISSVTWSPQGDKLLLQFRKKDADALEREKDEGKKKLGIVARRITRADFRMDGEGYLPEERWHIWTVNVASGEATQLTEGQYDEYSPRWSPDGKQIAFISNRSEHPDMTRELDDIYLISAGGGEPRQLPAIEGDKMSLSFSPDGELLSFVGREGLGNWCLMAGGSWNGNGDIPAHPSAWCKVGQGWVSVVNRTSNANLTIEDVKASRTVLRLWKNGASSDEHFLVEHRRQTGYDRKLPGEGLLVYHIDDAVDGNDNEDHPQVKLLEADNQAHLHNALNRGDDGDPYPGRAANKTLDQASSPHSKSYAGLDTCVAITKIRKAGTKVKAAVQVKCGSGVAPRGGGAAKRRVRKAVGRRTVKRATGRARR